MSGLFGGRLPKPEPASRMPDPQDPRILEAQRRRTERARTRGGRLSTILTDSLREITGSKGLLGA